MSPTRNERFDMEQRSLEEFTKKELRIKKDKVIKTDKQERGTSGRS